MTGRATHVPAAAPDRASSEALQRYSTVILPDVHAMTREQVAAVAGYLAAGGIVVMTDRVAEGLPAHDRLVTAAHDSADELVPLGPQVTTTASVAANVHELPDGSVALHLVNYDYEAAADRVRPALDVPLRIRLPKTKERATVVTMDGHRTPLRLIHDEDMHMVRVESIGVHAIVVLHDGELP